MVLAKSKNSVGLGNSLMNDRFGKGKGSDRKKVSFNAGAIKRTGVNGETYVTNPSEEASWVKMRSITEQAALDEFLSTAELAGTDFTAEKMNSVKIIHQDQKNPYLLSAADERSAVKKQQKNRSRLTVPRRPKWNSKTTRQELDIMERDGFLEWRRSLAELQEVQDILMTPFERNLEVWRQLWRVIERSDLIVQIVDARNPLLFRSDDLEKYVKEVDPKKRNLLLVNKADMMTLEQRKAWADYFEHHGIAYKFFSAALAKESIEAKEAAEDDSEEKHLAGHTKKLNLNDSQDEDDSADDEEESSSEDDDAGGLPLPPSTSKEDARTEILTVEELESLFLTAVPSIADSDNSENSSKKNTTTIGLVGYPNVGKSSTINALLGAKKVSVSATPGKTKHFQTLHLSSNLILCDCPGLVFPNFASTKAELVVNGVLPIDQLREYTGPAGIVAQRIPKHFLEAVYGMKILMRPLEEGGTGRPTAHEVLRAYARARGFATTGLGQPDESRAARYVLKDYVSGKLLFCHPPPEIEGNEGSQIDPFEFNKELYAISNLPLKRQEAIRSQMSASSVSHADDSTDANGEDLDLQSDIISVSSAKSPLPQGAKSRNIDSGFFSPNGVGSAGHQRMPFNYQYTEQGSQEKNKQLTGRKARTMIALDKGVDVSEVRSSGKKHFKGNKKGKTRNKGKAAVEDDNY